jgi:predicted glycoside hydrolase/deacetylase ChbG (UPF0249 family)
LTPSRIKSIWKTQIEALGGHLGGTRRIAHLDSHQHLHVLPGLWTAAKELQKEYGIPRLRVPYESLRRGLTHRFPFGLCMQALAGLRVDRDAPGFIGFFSSMRFTLAENHAALERVLLEPGRRFELMVHPALPAGPGTPAEAGGVPQALPSQEAEIAELRLTGEFFDRASQA